MQVPSQMPAGGRFEHGVASHCESGSLRNLLAHRGVEVSEPMVFGVGSGPAFYYLFFAKGPSTLPLVAIRNKPGSIVRNVGKLCGVDAPLEQASSTAEAVRRANALIDAGTPVAASVEMFRMRYLPSFLRVHAPFHFVVLFDRQGDSYSVSDPYHHEVATLAREDLEAAWSTHAPLAKDNLMCHVRGVPEHIDWPRASVAAIRRTCRNMILPPVVSKVFAFVGVEGMRTYAKRMREWPAKHSGSGLREGILFNAVGFEDQGTGGAAFRLMYGAFLHEVADIFASEGVRDLAGRMVEHGRSWRAVSRRMVVIGRRIPIDDEAYDDWHAEHGRELAEGLVETSERFLEFADVEEQLFGELAAAAKELRPSA